MGSELASVRSVIVDWKVEIIGLSVMGDVILSL